MVDNFVPINVISEKMELNSIFKSSSVALNVALVSSVTSLNFLFVSCRIALRARLDSLEIKFLNVVGNCPITFNSLVLLLIWLPTSLTLSSIVVNCDFNSELEETNFFHIISNSFNARIASSAAFSAAEATLFATLAVLSAAFSTPFPADFVVLLTPFPVDFVVLLIPFPVDFVVLPTPLFIFLKIPPSL